MRNLKSNLSLVRFKQFIGDEEILDQYGNLTGNFRPIYGELLTDYLCVSPNKGNTETEQFGTFTDYDRTMTTSNTNTKINEQSILWLDRADTNKPHNYIVKKRADWKNSVQFAVKEVNVTYADN